MDPALVTEIDVFEQQIEPFVGHLCACEDYLRQDRERHDRDVDRLDNGWPINGQRGDRLDRLLEQRLGA